MSALLAAFNQTIQDEAKDRKYRFHVKRLLKSHLRAGDAVDPDLDYITDDDDLAVLFQLNDGTKVWVLGNVEAVAVARGAVDKSRAVGPNAASYLRGLDADERPIKGVHSPNCHTVCHIQFTPSCRARMLAQHTQVSMWMTQRLCFYCAGIKRSMDVGRCLWTIIRCQPIKTKAARATIYL